MSFRVAETIRVIVADHDALTAHFLVSDLRRQRQFQVIECAPGTVNVLDCLAANSADVLLISIGLHEGPLAGVELLRRVRLLHPETRPVVFVEQMDRHLVSELFRAGARGILTRCEADVKRLYRCLRCVAAGQVWANSEQIGFVLEAFAEAASLNVVSANGEDLLTKREKDVVRMVTAGYLNREAAQQLGLSEHTVKNYLFNIFNKLGISTRSELIMYVLSHSDNKLVSPPAQPVGSTIVSDPKIRDRQMHLGPRQELLTEATEPARQ